MGTRVLFLGFTVFVALSVYVLVVTHHLKFPQVDLTASGHTGKHRDKVALDLVHHVLLEDFMKYDADKDGKLSVHEFAGMLRALEQRAVQDGAEGGGGTGLAVSSRETRERASNEAQSRAKPKVTPKFVTTQATDVGVRPGGVINLDEDHDDAYEGDDEYNDDDIDLDPLVVGGGEFDYSEEEARAEQAHTASQIRQTEQFDQAAAQQAGREAGAPSPPPSPPPPSPSPPPPTPSPPPPADTGAAAVVPANAGCPPLTRELISEFARENTIMLTVADWKVFGTLGLNWMKVLNSLGVGYYIVGATCAKTAQYLGHVGKHPCFKFYDDGKGHQSDEYKYGDSHYNAATWRKVQVVSRIVHWGFNVIHSDVDVVWFRDPLPYFLGPACKDVDMAVSSDLISTQNPVGDDGLEIGMHQHTNFNTGVYFIRFSPGGLSLIASWAAMRQSNIHDHDQFGIYKFIRERPTHMEGRTLVLEAKQGEAEAAAAFAKDPDHWVRATQKDPLPVSVPMRMGSLGAHMLLNGYSYFIPKLHERWNVSSLAIHMTWVPLSKEGKFHRFRDGMLYDDPPEYYDTPATRYITADIDAPDAPPGYNQWRETEDMIQVHLKNMPPQLQQAYRVAALSMVLKRTLIFPRLRCFCFKNWFMSEQCRIPGDKTTQFPLDCALDQVFRPKVLYNWPPLDTRNGPQNLTFREYSLLDNPRTPATVKNGQVLVVPEGFPVGNATGFTQVVTLKPNMTQDAIAAALEPHKDAKVLRLRHINHLFGGFDDQVLKASFDKWSFNVTANWCCRDEPYIQKGMAKKVKMVMEF
ncbi:hypothetical protein HYH03_014041 [Edaphochlamys debaryana]|uniref:EF-hand domain-containing protein n=1 Tax=Edaphochlamys debaryana TaxID=47281 RepID=A0A835XX29_9CHLO|nr:hypothetical protein HYH03_014041 [Edaphochlamys debaryana]|eukprot:KAG2487324.1 hypothetical protein HYH03_014041 [Edaphochlamys debaryana]